MAIISKKSRIALHGLAYLALSSRQDPVPFEEILGYLRAYSVQLPLSPTYIAKIFQDVSRAGFADSVSGPRGGYRLARPAAEISLIEIVESLDGPLLTGCCLAIGDCPRQEICGVRAVIHQAELAFYRFFEEETVASLAGRLDIADSPVIRGHR